MTTEERRAALSRSKSQLLIALRETTESENFTDIITNEFEGLPDVDTKMLLLVVGIATLARIGMSQEMAKEAYSSLAQARPYGDAMDALAGIVAPSDSRLYARHELYVRHIIERVVNFEDFHSVIHAILRTFLKFEIPIVKSVRRLDAKLFRFVLNNDFISEHASKYGNKRDGIKIYSDFEVEFQLDGHYWLQYGLFLAHIGRFDESIRVLRRSIQAYPQNPFAVHALADIQLRTAKERRSYDLATELIAEATAALKTLDANIDLEMDYFPIVTLAMGHVPALLKHKRTEDARVVAREYFDRLQQIEKRSNSGEIRKARERIFRFLTVNEFWERPLRSRLGKNNR